MKTIAIVGAGPGLGLSIAKKFGTNGFQVALISRNADKLNPLVDELKGLGIEAAAFPADLYNKEQLTSAFHRIKKVWLHRRAGIQSNQRQLSADSGITGYGRKCT